MHEWVDGTMGEPRCDHDAIDEPTKGKEWLVAGGQAHLALQRVIMNTKLLKTIPRYVNFRYIYAPQT